MGYFRIIIISPTTPTTNYQLPITTYLYHITHNMFIFYNFINNFLLLCKFYITTGKWCDKKQKNYIILLHLAAFLILFCAIGEHWKYKLVRNFLSPLSPFRISQHCLIVTHRFKIVKHCGTWVDWTHFFT